MLIVPRHAKIVVYDSFLSFLKTVKKTHYLEYFQSEQFSSVDNSYIIQDTKLLHTCVQCLPKDVCNWQIVDV